MWLLGTMGVHLARHLDTMGVHLAWLLDTLRDCVKCNFWTLYGSVFGVSFGHSDYGNVFSETFEHSDFGSVFGVSFGHSMGVCSV